MPQPFQDHAYLGQLQDYFAEHRSLPSFSHLARLLGLRSVSSAHAVGPGLFTRRMPPGRVSMIGVAISWGMTSLERRLLRWR